MRKWSTTWIGQISAYGRRELNAAFSKEPRSTNPSFCSHRSSRVIDSGACPTRSAFQERDPAGTRKELRQLPWAQAEDGQSRPEFLYRNDGRQFQRTGDCPRQAGAQPDVEADRKRPDATGR